MKQLKPEHQAVLDDPDHKFNKLQKKYQLLVKRLEKTEEDNNRLLHMVEVLQYELENIQRLSGDT